MTPVNGASGTGVMKIPVIFWANPLGSAAKTRKAEQKIPARAACKRIGNLQQWLAQIG
jgi:hypothetical protein